MGVRDRFSNYLYNRLQKRYGSVEDIYSHTLRYAGRYGTDDDILQSSDVYELMQDISNQIVLAKWTLEDAAGNEIKHHPVLQTLRKPNNYLTGPEFMKLLTNTYLLEGEVFPFYDGKQIHLAQNVYPELDKFLIPRYKTNGEIIPNNMIRHIKNMGTDWLKGAGLKQLGMNTLEGVMNAENVLTGKYKKGGLLAFLLKLDAHINPQNAAQSKILNAILDQLESIDESRTVKLIPLGKGYTIDSLKSPVEDEKILGFLNVYKKDLGKFFGINYDTYQALLKEDVEKAMMYLHNKVVRPFLLNLEEHLTQLLLGDKSNYRLKAHINILDFVSYSTKTNIAYNIVRTGITTPDIVAEKFLNLPPQNTPESTSLYISNDLSKMTAATDDSLKKNTEQKEEKVDS